MDKSTIAEIDANVIDVPAFCFKKDHVTGAELTAFDGAAGAALLGGGAWDFDV